MTLNLTHCMATGQHSPLPPHIFTEYLLGATTREQSKLELLYRYKAAFSLSISILSLSFLFLPPSNTPPCLCPFLLATQCSHSTFCAFRPLGKPLSIPVLLSWRGPLEPPPLQSLPIIVGRISKMASQRKPNPEIGNMMRNDSCDHTMFYGAVNLKMGQLPWIIWVVPLK